MSKLTPLRFSPVDLSPLRPSSTRLGWGIWHSLSPASARFVYVIPLTLALFALCRLQLSGTAPNHAVAASPPGCTTVTTATITIPTYAVEPALVQEFNLSYRMPYYRLDRDRYDPTRVENRTFTLIVLENDYLKLTVLPELGGRIYQAIFKPTGNNMFYQNPVLKPSPWGPPEMGWWLAVGGMEWGLPVEEHGYEWGVPWHYAVSDLADGVRVTVWDSDANDRLRATVSITLLDAQALFHVSPSIENLTDHPIDYKFWLNAMLAPGPVNTPSENMRFIMPGEQATVHSTGDPRLPDAWNGINWPVYNGVDWSRLGNWRQWFGFFQRPQAAGDFQAIYDESYDEGVVRAYNSGATQGVKFFAFGWGNEAISPDLYTDDRSSYVEMHGGVGPTFADTQRLEPGQRITWTEQWYPVAGLGGLTWANGHVALHLESRPNETRLHFTTSTPRPNSRVLVLRRDDNVILFDETVGHMMPGQPYHSPWIDTAPLSPSDLAVLISTGNSPLGVYQYQGPLPLPRPTRTVAPGPTQTVAPLPAWSGRVLRQVPVGGWNSVARIWVRNQYGLPVIIRSLDGSWSTTNTVGTKPEYGPDALEFAPLGPGTYVIEPQGLGAQVTVDLAPGVIAEILFEQPLPPRPTATPTPLLSVTPTLPAPSKPSTVTPAPSPTLIRVPTAAPALGWVGRELDLIAISGWSSVVRVWVRGQYGLPVTITAADDGWSTDNFVGSKPEYGPDALEFAPLGPG